ncbi:transcription initiation factor TFIID component TAF4 family-domain-containing protein, partial [Phycomyces blakesleeanus]
MAQHHPSNLAPTPPPVGPVQRNPNPPSAATSTTLLDNITSQLPPDRKEKFIELFRELQNNAVTADQFLLQAKMLLDQQHYQQLEDLKNKPSAQPNSNSNNSSSSSNNNNSNNSNSSTNANSNNSNINTANTANNNINNSNNNSNNNNNNINSNINNNNNNANTNPNISTGNANNNINTNANANPNANINDGEMVGGSLPDGVDRSKMQDFMNPDMLRDTVMKMAKPLSIYKIDPDFLSYLALATQDRLRHLIEQMVAASKHRVLSQTFDAPPVDEHGQPLYKIMVQQDIKKQLLAIERVEREEERKRKEIIAERERRAQLGDSDGMNVDEENRPKKKKKEKEMGPGVTARNMSEDIRKKHTNETALMSAGGV